jgi:uncharacterized protein (DUF433 family)
MDPRIEFGRPILKVSAIPTAVIGASRSELADDYGEDPLNIEEAVRYELQPAKAACQLYAGIVDVPEYGVRGKRGDFEPLISEELFCGIQAILSGRVPSTAPRKRPHPDFPLRGFVRCEIVRTRPHRQLVTSCSGVSPHCGVPRSSPAPLRCRRSYDPGTQPLARP